MPEFLETSVITTLAGPIAEAKLLGVTFTKAIRYGGVDDYRSFLDCVWCATETKKERLQLSKRLREQTIDFINKKWFAIENVARALLNKHYLTYEEVRRIVNDGSNSDI